MSLRHGSALQVEDLDLTLKCVTYRMPLLTTLRRVRRIVKNLKVRGIHFKLTEELHKGALIIPEHQIYLDVGDSSIWFGVTGE